MIPLKFTRFFRTHHPESELLWGEWRVRIDGVVERPLIVFCTGTAAASIRNHGIDDEPEVIVQRTLQKHPELLEQWRREALAHEGSSPKPDQWPRVTIAWDTPAREAILDTYRHVHAPE